MRVKVRDRLGAVVLVGVIGGSALGQSGVRSDQAGRDEAALLGAWRLVSIATIRPNGEEVTDWMGRKPSGLLMYQSNGYMSVQIRHDPPARWSHPLEDDASVEERATAYRRYYAYFGRYEVDLEQGVVRHRVESSLQPQEAGVVYERRFKLTGDQLLLTATPFTFKGEQRFNKLVWERVQ